MEYHTPETTQDPQYSATLSAMVLGAYVVVVFFLLMRVVRIRDHRDEFDAICRDEAPDEAPEGEAPEEPEGGEEEDAGDEPSAPDAKESDSDADTDGDADQDSTVSAPKETTTPL